MHSAHPHINLPEVSVHYLHKRPATYLNGVHNNDITAPRRLPVLLYVYKKK